MHCFHLIVAYCSLIGRIKVMIGCDCHMTVTEKTTENDVEICKTIDSMIYILDYISVNFDWFYAHKTSCDIPQFVLIWKLTVKRASDDRFDVVHSKL